MALVAGACGGGDGGGSLAGDAAQRTDGLGTGAVETTDQAGASDALGDAATDVEATQPSTTAASPSADQGPGEASPAAPAPDDAGERVGPAEATSPAPVAPGSYRYRQSGYFQVGATREELPPEGTLAADAAGPDGTQVMRRAIDPEQPPNETTYRFAPDGMFILETVQRSAGMEVRCRFDAPGMPAPPWPPRAGATFAGHADCGELTVDVSGAITGQRQVPIDGGQVDVLVVESTVTTSGAVESTSNLVDWFAPSLRLSVRNETDMEGRFGAVSFESRSVSELVSGRPS